MGLFLAARVKETTITTGTGSLDLDGAPAGYQTFLTAFGAANQCYYAILDGLAWEYGLGRIQAGNQLDRELVINSSSGGALISLGSGTKTVLCAIPPEASTSNGVNAFPDGSATPSVKHGRVFIVDNTNTTTITNFLDGIQGQEIILWFANSQTTIQNNTNIKLSGGNNWLPGESDVLCLVFGWAAWYERSRSQN